MALVLFFALCVSLVFFRVSIETFSFSPRRLVLLFLSLYKIHSFVRIKLSKYSRKTSRSLTYWFCFAVMRFVIQSAFRVLRFLTSGLPAPSFFLSSFGLGGASSFCSLSGALSSESVPEYFSPSSEE